MNATKAILFTGGRISIPVMRNLSFNGQLAAILIPEHCSDFIEQIQILLRDSGIPVITVNKENLTNTIEQVVKKYNPAIGIVFGFSFKLPASVFALVPKGFYNIHPGPLPTYRGPDPIFRQIKNKELYAALSIHKIDDEFDSGPIVLSDKIRLSVTDTHGILTSRLSEMAAILIETLMKMVVFDMSIPSRIQDASKVNYYKRQSATDITINWQTMDATDIIALINACNPWNKGAVTKINNRILRLLSAHKGGIFAGNAEAGTVISIDETGIGVALINNESLIITHLYCEEGFLPAGRLKEFAMVPGSKFESL